MSELEQRLQFLEREFQRSRRMNRLLVMSVVIVGCVASAQVAIPQSSQSKDRKQDVANAQSDPASSEPPLPMRTLEAEEVVLHDQSGQPRIRMGVVGDSPAISMWDGSGKKRLELGLSSVATGLQLFDAAGAPMVSLNVPNKAGHSQLAIRSPQGHALIKADGITVIDSSDQPRLQLALLNGNYPLLGISQAGQTGPPSIELVAGEGSRSWKMHDADGHPLFSVASNQGSHTTLTMQNPEHERSLQMSVGPSDAEGPKLSLFAPANVDGSGGQLPLVQIGLRKNQQPYIRISDDAGRATFAAP